jgi:hypothetical protein
MITYRMKYLAEDGNVIIQVQQSTKSSSQQPQIWHCAGLFGAGFYGTGYYTILEWRLKSGHLRLYFYRKPTSEADANALAAQCNGPAPDNSFHPGRFYNSGIRGSETMIITA